MDVTTAQQQITDAQALLAQVTAAITAVLDPTVSRYTLDTGQTVETVDRGNLMELYAQRTLLQNEICTLQLRVSGGGVTRGQPAW